MQKAIIITSVECCRKRWLCSRSGSVGQKVTKPNLQHWKKNKITFRVPVLPEKSTSFKRFLNPK